MEDLHPESPVFVAVSPHVQPWQRVVLGSGASSVAVRQQDGIMRLPARRRRPFRRPTQGVTLGELAAAVLVSIVGHAGRSLNRRALSSLVGPHAEWAASPPGTSSPSNAVRAAQEASAVTMEGPWDFDRDLHPSAVVFDLQPRGDIPLHPSKRRDEAACARAEALLQVMFQPGDRGVLKATLADSRGARGNAVIDLLSSAPGPIEKTSATEPVGRYEDGDWEQWGVRERLTWTVWLTREALQWRTLILDQSSYWSFSLMNITRFSTLRFPSHADCMDVASNDARDVSAAVTSYRGWLNPFVNPKQCLAPPKPAGW